MRQKLLELKKALEERLVKVGDRAKKTKESANEIAQAASLSPSQSGDREHSRGQARVVEESLIRLKKLHEEVVGASKEPVRAIFAPCFIVFEKEGEKNEAFLVENPVFVKGVSFISTSSDLGKALMGKKVGDKVRGRTIIAVA